METPAKKIFYLITKSNWGGAQQYVYRLASAAHETGAEVAVLAGGTGAPGAAPGALATTLTEAGIRFIPIAALGRDISVAAEFRAFFEIKKILKTEQPDIVHVNSSKAAGIGALAARLAGVPRIIFTAHGWPHQEPRPWYARATIWFASYLSVLLAHQTIVLSAHEHAIAPAIGIRKKVRIIPLGVAPFPLHACGEARRVLGLSEGFWFATGTELTRNKGIDNTIAAFAQVAALHPRARLAIIGDGELRHTLAEQAAMLGIGERVVFTGFVPNVKTYLSAVDCFVLASHKEGLPFILLEAGMAHVPVIATQVGSVSDIITHEQTGLVVPPASVSALITAMLRMIEDGDLRNQSRERLHAHVTRSFAEQTMCTETMHAYHAR